MRYAVTSALIVGLLATVACNNESAAKSDQPAGVVLSLSGSATASRGGASRDLAVGAELFGDDTIETADGAELVIELSHNGARWTLPGAQKRRVDESAAWRAEKQTGTRLADNQENRTNAAGRHTEREAAETEQTSGSTDDSEEDTSASETRGSGQTAAPVPETEPDPVSDSARDDRDRTDGIVRRRKPPSKGSSSRPKSREKPKLEALEKPKKALSSRFAVSGISVAADGGLSKKLALAAVTAAKSDLGRCAAKATEVGTARATVSVSADGSVRSVRMSGKGGAAFQSCARSVLSTRKFESRDDATSVRVTIVLAPIE